MRGSCCRGVSFAEVIAAMAIVAVALLGLGRALATGVWLAASAERLDLALEVALTTAEGGGAVDFDWRPATGLELGIVDPRPTAITRLARCSVRSVPAHPGAWRRISVRCGTGAHPLAAEGNRILVDIVVPR